jgi:hypothetical protein
MTGATTSVTEDNLISVGYSHAEQISDSSATKCKRIYSTDTLKFKMQHGFPICAS